jgi:D-3-phosphoglycerate dehydrogenase
MAKILCSIEVNHLPRVKQEIEGLGNAVFTADYEQTRLALADADVVITNLSLTYDESLLSAARRLRLIATPSTGTDHIDMAYAAKRGIEVMSVKADYDLLKTITSAAELAWGLLLAANRRIPAAFDHVKQGGWESKRFVGHELSGQVMGIIGYGRLGEMVADYARAFRMKVIATDPCARIPHWIESVSLEHLLRTADYVSLHVHLTDDTRGMLGQREFGMMKPGAVFVNTSRGALVDEGALIRALESGRLRAAGIDVRARELELAPAEDPLVDYANAHDNLVITPHMGGVSFESQEKVFLYLIGKIREFLQAA